VADGIVLIVFQFTMKFAVNSVTASGARLGLLTDFIRIPNVALETPYLLLHTRGASVPHLSYDLLQMVTTEVHTLQMPLTTVVDSAENVRKFGKGIAEFAGLKVDQTRYHQNQSHNSNILYFISNFIRNI